MKILLLGEFSNVHWNLAQGLRFLGHEVTVASDGDSWKNYHRDVDLRRSSLGIFDTLKFLYKLLRALPQFQGYDVVQIINPVFLPLKAEHTRWVYNYLRKHNKSIFMGAFGMDHYYVKACMDMHTFRYSDFNIGNSLRKSPVNTIWINEWLNGEKGKWNQFVANDCNGIISGLYEYHVSYAPYFPDKTKFIPYPIPITHSLKSPSEERKEGPIRFFIGIQKARSSYKGTDIMLQALEDAKKDYPDKIEIVKVESVPFEQYQQLLSDSDVILDQLYSYTPAMNALTAMEKGLVLIGGGEPEMYPLMGDEKLQPIVNVLPNKQSVYDAIVDLALHPEKVADLSHRTLTFIRQYHDAHKVAQQYIDFWKSRL